MTDMKPAVGIDPLLRWFQYDHLKPELQQFSREFANLAYFLVDNLQPSPERSVALRKLLEAKDAGVRSKLYSDEAGGIPSEKQQTRR